VAHGPYLLGACSFSSRRLNGPTDSALAFKKNLLYLLLQFEFPGLARYRQGLGLISGAGLVEAHLH